MKKGLTFLTIVVAVIVMMIFATTATIAVVNVANDSTKTKFATEVAYIQEAVNNYYIKNNEYPVGESVTVDLQNVKVNDIVQFVNEDKNNNSVIMYIIDRSLLGNIETIYGNSIEEGSNDVYAVSKKTGKVYYLKGVKAGNTTYFTLTDELKERINYVDKDESAIIKDSISFKPSTTEWTNKNVVTTVRVPDKYSDISVNILNNGVSTPFTNSTYVGDFYEYKIDTVAGNYTINVSYKNNNGENLTQSYSVSNYDNEPPTLEVSNKKDLNSSEGNYSYVKINSKNDNLSGIKCIKYERENIDDSDIETYFKTNGLELKEDIIEIKDNTSYVTIYIEDNAGNFARARINF